MKYLSLLALFSSSLVLAESLNKNFTVNLLTQDPSVAITNLDPSGEAGIAFDNAAIKHVYDNNVYSVVGSMAFTDKNMGQKCHLQTDKFSVDVDISLLNAGADTVWHQDVEIGKDPSNDSQFWFDQLPDKIENVDFDMKQENRKDGDERNQPAAIEAPAVDQSLEPTEPTQAV